MRALRKSLGIKFGLPQPKWSLKIGAWFMRTESELILKSRWVYPKRLLDEGFKFKHPEVNEALSFQSGKTPTIKGSVTKQTNSSHSA
ncbi:MAG TPA: DUF1731 domain-containing protein [Crocinitomicaceae bacterium]|nr:DUF1731 domain-containing protein [Crocinitomicaceae bacterium]